jgi:hypothetical protein
MMQRACHVTAGVPNNDDLVNPSASHASLITSEVRSVALCSQLGTESSEEGPVRIGPVWSSFPSVRSDDGLIVSAAGQ